MSAIHSTEAKIFLTDIIKEAGEMLKRYHANGFATKSKGGFDIVTEADEAVDAFLQQKIREKYPDTQLLTEETAPKDYWTLQDVENLWVIDPLDGTLNFARGHRHFAISIAFVQRGHTEFGMVYIPFADQLYWAARDQDKALLNDQPISVSLTTELAQSLVAGAWPWEVDRRDLLSGWIQRLAKHTKQTVIFGCAVGDLASIADGRLDAYFSSGLKPWDMAATSLLIEKAGGRITHPDGSEWHVFQPGILASNGLIHEQLVAKMNQ